MIQLVNLVNGKIVLLKRQDQLKKVLTYLKLEYIPTDVSIINKTAWLAGFMDAEGSFTINGTTLQAAISISQKDRLLLETVQTQLNYGSVYPDNTRKGFKFYISERSDIEKFLLYLEKFGLKSWRNI